ncbi:uncharacterized protein LOC127279518, partial [Leptopilina boulardi]|uniref:uncharacterized protein LOC127279518 n=1 Tax=Leptopilina boulardi TaxID=63433 RepID=UPI0021F69642
QEGRSHHSGPYRSLSERGYSSASYSSQYGSYSGYSNVPSSDYYQYQSSGNVYYQLQGGYYSPQSSGPPFPGVQRYGSLAEEAWPISKDESGLFKTNSKTYLA